MRPFAADGVGVRPQGQRDHIGLQAVDHRAGLTAGAAVRLVDRHLRASFFLVLGDEAIVEVAPQLARRS